MLAIAYARFSSDNQREESIAAQLRAIREYAVKNNITIIREYCDEARSATTTENRDNFLRMMEDIQTGRVKVDLCLIHKYDRFARDDYDHVVNERKLQNKKVRLLAVDQPLDDSPEGNLTKTLLIGLAKYYSQNLARETMKGLKENALKALHCGGRPPYGLNVDKDTKKYILNTKEQEAVNIMADMVLQGEGYSRILKVLHERGFRNRSGKPFTKSTIYDILRNPKIYGVFFWNAGSEDTNCKRALVAGTAKDEMIWLPGALPEVVPYAKMERIWAILDQRKKTSPRRRGEVMYILTGKLKCGECGGAYVGNSRKGGKNKIQYYLYSCNHRKATGQCKNKEIRKEILENAVLDRIQQIFFSGDINEWAEKLEGLYTAETDEMKGEEEKLKKELSKINQSISNLYRVIEKGLDDDETIGRMQRLKEQRQKLQSDLEYVQIRQNVPFTREHILEYLRLNRDIVYDRSKPAECKDVIDRFVEKIIITSEKISMQLKFSMDVDTLVVPTGFEPVSPP